MRTSTTTMRTVIHLVAATLATAAFADAPSQVDEVTVKAIRGEQVGRTSNGIPIVEVATERRVTFADISLTTDSGVKVFEARIRDAARSACGELQQKYPIPVQDGTDCYSEAVAAAMNEAQKAIETAKQAAMAANKQ
jgi:UrcA family protein